MAEVSRLLVLGDDAESAAALLSRLQHLCGGATSEIPASNGALGHQQQRLTLRTKYYSAEVDALVAQVRDGKPAEPLELELHEFEAVLCVFNPADRLSFVHGRDFLQQLAESGNFEVSLLVGNTRPQAATAGVKMMEVDRAYLEGWCQDYAFEFVSVDEDGNQEEDEGMEEEKRGLDRVLEALECNMWRSMVRPPAPVAQPATSAAAGVDDSNQQTTKEEDSQIGSNQVEDDEEAYGDDDRLQTLLRALEITEGTSEAAPASPSAERRTSEDEADMAEFSALIEQVRRVRDQGQVLDDEQRRQQAAEVAMRLWNFLGVDDEDDGDSSSE